MRIIAVDPGLNGKLVVISGGIPLHFYDMPTVKIASKIRTDAKGIAEILKSHTIDCVVVEHVGASPQMGTASAFGFGYSYCAIIATCAGAGIPCHTISPQKWKSFFGLLKKPKDAARLKVIDMFPNLREELKFKKDIDKADAVLIGLAWLSIEGVKSEN